MHDVVKQICEFLLEPHIPTTGKRLKVADIGAGTGIWAIQALVILPADAELTAFDSSAEQLPPPELVPERVYV